MWHLHLEVTKTWRLRKAAHLCGRLDYPDVRRRRLGPLLVGSVPICPDRGALLNTAHSAVHLDSELDTTVVIPMKKKQTPEQKHFPLPEKDFDGRLQSRRGNVLRIEDFTLAADSDSTSSQCQSENDTTTTWPPSCRLSLGTPPQQAWLPWSWSERGNHSAVRGSPINFRDISWWPPLFFHTQTEYRDTPALTQPSSTTHTMMAIRTRFAPNSNAIKHYHLLFQTGVDTAWPQRFQSFGLTTSQIIVQYNIGRDLGPWHSEQEGRINARVSLEPRPSSPPDLRPSGRGPGKTSILFCIFTHYTVHSEFFSQTLFDFKKSISGPIELKFSGKTLYAILQPEFLLWWGYF